MPSFFDRLRFIWYGDSRGKKAKALLPPEPVPRIAAEPRSASVTQYVFGPFDSTRPFDSRVHHLVAYYKAERELWNTYLTDFQRSEAYETGLIPVRGSEGGTWLVPVEVTSYSVVTRPSRREGTRWVGYCLIVRDGTHYDSVIAKVLLLQADEKRFVRIANRA